MYLAIAVFVELLLVADIICAEAFKVKPLEIGTSGTIPCDHVENDPEVRVVQWYKSRIIDAFENGDASIASWTDGETRSLPNYHIENTTLSLVIDNATLEDEGLYKCFVARGDLFTGSNYYIRTVIYALPRMDPEITLNTDDNLVHCTVEHVKPMLYPVLNFEGILDSTETNTVLNEDGTYTTSVYCTLPQDKSVSRVDCSFSYLHYQRVASLDLSTTSDSLTEDKTTTVSPMSTSITFAGDGCTCMTISQENALTVYFIGSTVMLVVLLLEMMRRAGGAYYRRRHTLKKAEESEVKMFRPAEGMGAEMTARDGPSQSSDF